MDQAKTQVLHVSADAHQGDGTQASPMSLPQALAAAKPGTTILLAAGQHAPAVAEGVCGDESAPVVIRGAARPPVDLSSIEQIDRHVYVQAIRQALADGLFTLPESQRAALSVIGGQEANAGLLLLNCRHVVLENLVITEATQNLVIRSCQHVLVKDCVVTGHPRRSVCGVALHTFSPQQPPSRHVRLQGVLAYGMKENGFVVSPGCAFDVEWDCCVAHGMYSDGGDGFSFSHVTPTDSPGAHPGRMYPDGIDYRMKLRRCAALSNRLDGFDLGQGVGGVTLEFCLGDGNGWGAYFAKDIKVWSSNNTLRRTRMTGRVLFVSGSNRLEDFKTGCEEDGPAGKTRADLPD